MWERDRWVKRLRWHMKGRDVYMNWYYRLRSSRINMTNGCRYREMGEKKVSCLNLLSGGVG
jgi:hypothetical protein